MEYPSRAGSHQQQQQFIAELDASNPVQRPAPTHDGLLYELPAESNKPHPQNEVQETQPVPTQANPWPFYLEDASPRVYQGQQNLSPSTETSSDPPHASPWPYHGPIPAATGHLQADSAPPKEAQPALEGNAKQKQYVPYSSNDDLGQEDAALASQAVQSAPSVSSLTHTAHYIPYRLPTSPSFQNQSGGLQSPGSYSSSTPISPVPQSPFITTPPAKFQPWPTDHRPADQPNDSNSHVASPASTHSPQVHHNDTTPSHQVAPAQASYFSAKLSSADPESNPGFSSYPQPQNQGSPSTTLPSHIQGPVYNPVSPSTTVPNTPPPAYSETQPPSRHNTGTYTAANGPSSSVSSPALAPPPLPPRPSSAQSVPSFGFSAPHPHAGTVYPPPPKKNSYPGIPPPPPPRPYNHYQRPPSNRLFGSTSAKKWLDKTNQVLEETIDAVLQGPAGPPHRPAYVQRPQDRPPQPPRPPQGYPNRPS